MYPSGLSPCSGERSASKVRQQADVHLLSGAAAVAHQRRPTTLGAALRSLAEVVPRLALQPDRARSAPGRRTDEECCVTRCEPGSCCSISSDGAALSPLSSLAGGKVVINPSAHSSRECGRSACASEKRLQRKAEKGIAGNNIPVFPFFPLLSASCIQPSPVVFTATWQPHGARRGRHTIDTLTLHIPVRARAAAKPSAALTAVFCVFLRPLTGEMDRRDGGMRQVTAALYPLSII